MVQQEERQMGEGIKKKLSILLAAALLLWGIYVPAEAQEQRSGVTVTSTEEFMAALEQKKSPITIGNNIITIVNGAESSGRMLPVTIPAGTVIQGATNDNTLNCRSPIQLGGDGVVFRNMKLVMSSSNALNSVPHREIFLAGYSLTMDNVKTFLDGGDGSFGPLGGTEKELLPTIYAGAYPGTSPIGSNASLTVQNSNDETMFQAIYMGHGAIDGDVSYQGAAELKLDAKAIVRESVDASLNSRAEIQVSGTRDIDYAKAKQFKGNEATTFTLKNCSIEDATVDGIGNLVIESNGQLIPKTEVLKNVTLKSGGCLNLNNVTNAQIQGDFTGVSLPDENQGILVLNKDGHVRIQGTVTGTTIFCTGNNQGSGMLYAGKEYISANPEKSVQNNFALHDRYVSNDFQLEYQNGVWQTAGGNFDSRQVKGVSVKYAPREVDVSKIEVPMDGDDTVIQDKDIYFELVWYDEEGKPFSAGEAEELMLYETDYVIGIKTEYWETDSPDILQEIDWANTVRLMVGEGGIPDRYYLCADEGAKSGDYTFLFLSDYYQGNLDTVADVKALKDKVIAEKQIIFWNSSKGETKPELPEEPTPSITPTPEPTDTPKPTDTPIQPPATPTPGATGTPKPDPTGAPAQPPATLTPGATGTPEPKPPVTPPSGQTPSGPETHTHKYVQILQPATFQKDGVKMKKCSCGKILEQQAIYQLKKAELSQSEMVYNGKSKKPSVKVTDRLGRIISSRNYQLVYQNNINVGQATVVVIFKGDYKGSQKKNFTIDPKGTSLSKLKAKKKGLTISWNRQASQTSGYEIQYSTSSKFTKKATKTVTVKNSRTTSRSISKLKAKKKYYVRIRTYKNAKVNGKTKKFYSGWSKSKSVKTKK
ncbi:MAG: hypothetical protein HFH43_11665 [Lachnospiraceae bacterium]|nr:hypothetical protein [Lachnospiraceae bacterium]